MELSKFQEYYKKHPHEIPKNAFEKFKEFHPELTGQKARQEFERQISELFFKRA